jgi:hypothetical protein
MNFKWVDDNRQYSNGEILYIGKWNVGAYIMIV